ncbi:MAG: RNA polymerase III transcription factor IIIC subunit-domain-containing protein [Monoraphidium minutum]|nr:MAG: RNA polymerase III transcription factor IIIC subunit-domain-containing protein [Monoraphidium minutum]
MEVDSDSQGGGDGSPPPASGSGGGSGAGAGADALRVPPLEAVAIEFPGYIRNVDRAMAALGGAPEAAAALDARARAAAAVVRASYRFSGLADFQYLPVDPRAGGRSLSSLPEKNRPDAAEAYRTVQPFLLVPPLFSRVDVPLDFAFRDGGGDAPEDEAAAAEADALRVISFYNPEAPPPLPPPAWMLPPSEGGAEGGEEEEDEEDEGEVARRAAGRELLQALRDALARRPVWPWPALARALPEGADEGAARMALAALCYQFKTGPWKAQFVRCGYDPRTDRGARRYQAVSYRCPQEWYDRVRAARAQGVALVEPTYTELHTFAAMPLHRTSTLVLEDVDDEAVRQLLRSGPWPERATEAYGWCSHSGLQQLGHAAALRFGELLAAGHEPRPAEGGGGGEGAAAAGAAGAGAGAAPAARGAAAARRGAAPMDVDGGGAGGAGGGGGAALPLRTVGEAGADAAALLPDAVMDGLVREMEAAPGEVRAWLSAQQAQQAATAAAAAARRRRPGGESSGAEASETDGGSEASQSDWASEGE